jgi:thioredoxin reductase (NADPH)
MNERRWSDVDCLVVGGGPAGLTAAIYLRRFERSVLLVDAGASRALRIPRAHNYPGFPAGIPGPRLLQRLRRQLGAAGGAVTAERVTRLVRARDAFHADAGAATVRARRVLLATGVVDREPALPGLDEVRALGRLRMCPVCDGHEFRGARLVVVGSDAHALREAEFLSTFSADIRLVAVSDTPPGAAAVETARQRQRAWWPHAAAALAAHGETVVVQAADGATLHCDVVYLALGVTPTSTLARDLGAALTDTGTIRIDPHGQTSVPGLYAAGDVVDALDQLAVAAGQAAIAATAIHNSLR